MSDSSSSSDEEDAYLAAAASVAVTGASICAKAAESAKAASQKLRPRFSTHSHNAAEAGNGMVSTATRISLADDLAEEEKPLQGQLAEKLTKQLHSLLDRTVGASFEPPESAQHHVKELRQEDGAGEASRSDSSVDTGVRMFKNVAEGTPCVVKSQAAGRKARSHTSWATALRGNAGDGSDDEREVLKAAWTVAIDPEDLLQAAAAAAEAALEHVVVMEEVDSDTEWRGGGKPGWVKPGSSIEQKRRQKKAKAPIVAMAVMSPRDVVKGPAGEDALPQKARKRKGKKERQKEQQKMCSVSSPSAAQCKAVLPAVVQAGPVEDSDKLERKRAKRRELKKRRKLAGKDPQGPT
eukprot:CAMPEP_0117653522 /NCGR_PEP_ID=MMETSP0804-20121206/3238_1 /TAXON_ID=1074897 /ORGANISM="Tetraselmis astigmatica, Strain CCMP880" /LENGTH=350 /DNA_ID=CAMNT_0005459707 /DNA_START=278 /DNA_END=1330 /DNA_ORIENTATION=+